jgi:hypothetical protein
MSHCRQLRSRWRGIVSIDIITPPQELREAHGGPRGPECWTLWSQVGAEQSCPPPSPRSSPPPTLVVYRAEDLVQRRGWPPDSWLPVCQTHTRFLEHRKRSLTLVVRCLSLSINSNCVDSCLLEDYHVCVCILWMLRQAGRHVCVFVHPYRYVCSVSVCMQACMLGCVHIGYRRVGIEVFGGKHLYLPCCVTAPLAWDMSHNSQFTTLVLACCSFWFCPPRGRSRKIQVLPFQADRLNVFSHRWGCFLPWTP